MYPVHMYGNMDAINVWGTGYCAHCQRNITAQLILEKKDPKGYYNSNAAYCCSINPRNKPAFLVW